MGNKLTLAIHLDHERYGKKPIVAGTLLKGKVIVQLKRKLTPGELKLQLVGTESTVVKTSRTSLREKKVIARATTILKDFHHQTLEKGTHTIPFEFVLPSSLPSTTQFPITAGRAFNGRIHYEMKADLVCDTICQCNHPFDVVAAPLPSDIVPCMVEPTTHEMKAAFGIMKKGFLSTGASVENTRVGKGMVLKVSVASRNDTTVNIDRVRIKLVEKIEYHAKNQTDVYKTPLGKLKDVDLPGLHKSKSNRDIVRKTIQQGFASNIEQTYTEIYRELLSGRNSFEVVVPKTARDSYNGVLMTISHYLKITFITKSMTDNPSTIIPLVIGNPQQNEAPHEDGTRLHEQPNEAMATMIFPDVLLTPETPDAASVVEVGSRAESAPLAHAVMLGSNELNLSNPVARVADAHILVDDSDGSMSEVTDYYESMEAVQPPHGPLPSAPDESLLMCQASSRESSYERQESYLPTALGGINTANLSGVRAFTGGGNRGRVESFSYTYSEDSTVDNSEVNHLQQRLGFALPSNNNDDAQPATTTTRIQSPEVLLRDLLAELGGSIHDYEVVVMKTREQSFVHLFRHLKHDDFGRIVEQVSMSHQVQVALLLAKQMDQVDVFTCKHCATAVQKTSEYFRPNMVQTLLPYCIDLARNRKIIQDELTEWEQILSAGTFDRALRARGDMLVL